MPAIKICGLTRPEDALLVAACGADALGFIFYPKSLRCVTPEQAKGIIDRLPESPVGITAGSSVFPSPGRIATVGVFVNESPRQIKLDCLPLQV